MLIPDLRLFLLRLSEGILLSKQKKSLSVRFLIFKGELAALLVNILQKIDLYYHTDRM